MTNTYVSQDGMDQFAFDHLLDQIIAVTIRTLNFDMGSIRSIIFMAILSFFLSLEPFICGLPQTALPFDRLNGMKKHGDICMITRGEEVVPHSKPFAVLLRPFKHKEMYRCGGSILDEFNVVTAAHCLEGKTKVRVFFGKHYEDKREPGSHAITISPSSFVFHEQRNRKKSEVKYDIALIHLPSPITFTETIMPVGMATQDPVVGQSLEALGWGKMNRTHLSKVLKNTTNKVLPLNSHLCYGKPIEDCDPAHLICLDNSTGVVCKGDSGSPLLNECNQQVGVASHAGQICGIEEYQCYTSTVFFRDWIIGHMKKLF